MTEIIETIKSDNYVANIHIDDMPCSPREDDNFGTLIAFHSKYDLSDNKNYTKEELIEHMKAFNVFSLPVYMYEHSGIALSTTPFNCEWDSGQVGYIFVTYDKMLNVFGEVNYNRAEECLVSEIEEYSNYLKGEVYGYQIYKKGNCENCSDDVHSCWGIYGLEWVQEEVKDQLDYLEEYHNVY